MAISFVNASTASGTGTGNLTFTNEAVDDILLVAIERGGADTNQAAPAGWTQFSFSPITDGSSQVQVFWKRATSTNEAAFAVSDGGDHFIGVAMIFRGASKATDPWETITSNANTTASTTFSWTAGSTTVPECLLIGIASNPTDTTTSQVASITIDGKAVTTNSSLTNNVGNGGGIHLYYAQKADAGAIGNSSGSWIASATSCTAFLALRPAPVLVHTKTPPSVTVVSSSTDYTLTLNSTDGPDGTTTATLATDIGTTQTFRSVTEIFSVGEPGRDLATIEATYAAFFKIYVPTRKWACVRVQTTGFTAVTLANLETKSIISVSSNSTAVLDEYPYGWFRLSLTTTGITPNTNWQFEWWSPVNGTASTNQIGVAGEGFYYWKPTAVAGPYSYFQLDRFIFDPLDSASFYTYRPGRIMIT